MKEDKNIIKKYKLKIEEVEVVKVSDILDTMKVDWYSLPDWFRDTYESGNVIITYHSLEWKLFNTWIKIFPEQIIVKYRDGRIFPDHMSNFDLYYEEIRE
jgi:hypothetical protein